MYSTAYEWLNRRLIDNGVMNAIKVSNACCHGEDGSIS